MITVGAKIGSLEADLLTDIEIPIPVCNANFSLEGRWCFSSCIKTLEKHVCHTC